MSSTSNRIGWLAGAAAVGTLWALAVQADGPTAGQPQVGSMPAPKTQTAPQVVHKKAPPHHPGVTPAKPPAPPAQ
jgi:hypothetical protein